MAVIARQQRWQRGRRVAASSGGSGGQGVNSTTLAGIRHHCCAATVYSRGGDEDTCGDSNGRGTDNNQQSTKRRDDDPSCSPMPPRSGDGFHGGTRPAHAIVEDSQQEYPKIRRDHDVAVCPIPGTYVELQDLQFNVMWHDVAIRHLRICQGRTSIV